MRHSVLFLCLFLIFHASAQEDESTSSNRHFGVAINTSLLGGEIGSISSAITGLYYQNKHQFELGLALHPRESGHRRNVGGEFNYKYFPNGIKNRFNMYFSGNLTYTNQKREYNYTDYLFSYDFVSGHYTYSDPFPVHYERRMNFLTLTAGYGFQVKIFKGLYTGTALNVGFTTCNYRVIGIENHPSYSSNDMFGEYYLSGAVRLNVGYRF